MAGLTYGVGFIETGILLLTRISHQYDGPSLVV